MTNVTDQKISTFTPGPSGAAEQSEPVDRRSKTLASLPEFLRVQRHGRTLAPLKVFRVTEGNKLAALVTFSGTQREFTKIW